MSRPYKSIIIDDELPAREGLFNLLKSFPETFKVIDMAQNATEGKEKIDRLKPDIIFLDIEMPGCNGFELLKRLETIPFVIFCTAYDQYSLKAFETNSLDYLVKPIKLERLEITVQKLNSLDDRISSQHLLKAIEEMSLKKEKKIMTSLTIKKGDKLIFVKLENISHFESKDNYTNVHISNTTYLTELPLSQLELKLPDYFLRVHRGVIINTNYIEEIEKHFNSRFIIKLISTKKQE